jgi:sugar lactone lactonase YvrE/pimeloyl-ACP methyl ester carboxylesterase
MLVVLALIPKPGMAANGAISPEELTFPAADGITLYGDLYRASKSKSDPLILLFHQGDGDARGEYGPLAPRLLERGYHVLAVDQRRGGTRLGGTNRTVAALEGKEYSYCDAYADLEAALQFALEKGFSGKKIAWGSSYSAALAIRLAAEHEDDVGGVLAFSPASGDPMAGCRAEEAAPRLKLPALILRPVGEMQQEETRKQLALFLKLGFEAYVADPGTHGSSMLSPDRVGGNTEQTWKVVLAFLDEVVSGKKTRPLPQASLEEVATDTNRWTGIAVSRTGRVFVNYPRWSPVVPISVGELQSDGIIAPYPGPEFNDWTMESDPGGKFVCVQSVHVDRKDRLWILDPASPLLMGVVPGGAKLMQIDLARDSVVRTYTFDATVAPRDSYLNDVRIDTVAETAFITDSRGSALVVLDLKSGEARRVLDDHSTTQAETIEIIIDGISFPNPVHADGIALDMEGGWLYFQALTGRTLYRVPTAALRDAGLSPEELGEAVERVATSGVSDGLLFGPGGVYVSALEHGSVRRVDALGRITTVVKDPRIVWPDSFALGADGSVWFTTAQIHLGPTPPEPFRILRFAPPSP